MADRNTILIGIVIVCVFLWRFARTRRLYLTPLYVHTQGQDPIRFKPHDLRSFLDQGLLGRRSVEPVTFFVRAFVLAVVAMCLFPLNLSGSYSPKLAS